MSRTQKELHRKTVVMMQQDANTRVALAIMPFDKHNMMLVMCCGLASLMNSAHVV